MGINIANEKCALLAVKLNPQLQSVAVEDKIHMEGKVRGSPPPYLQLWCLNCTSQHGRKKRRQQTKALQMLEIAQLLHLNVTIAEVPDCQMLQPCR